MVKTYQLKQHFRLGGERFDIKDQAGQEVAQISKEFFRLTSTYQLTIFDESYTDLVVSLAVAIDYVEMVESRS